MPQELRVVCCCSCKTFQVDIIKKSSQWKCKMCNLKQILQKVHFEGTGHECRVVTQELNKQRIEHEMEMKLENIHESINKDERNQYNLPIACKWDEHLSNHEVIDMDISSSDEEEEASGYDLHFKAFMKELGIDTPYSKQHENELIDKFKKLQNVKAAPAKILKWRCNSEHLSEKDENTSDFKGNHEVNQRRDKQESHTVPARSFWNVFGDPNEDISDLLNE